MLQCAYANAKTSYLGYAQLDCPWSAGKAALLFGSRLRIERFAQLLGEIKTFLYAAERLVNAPRFYRGI